MKRKLVSNCAILETLIITGLKSDAILSVVDRNVAIFFDIDTSDINFLKAQVSLDRLV